MFSPFAPHIDTSYSLEIGQVGTCQTAVPCNLIAVLSPEVPSWTIDETSHHQPLEPSGFSLYILPITLSVRAVRACPTRNLGIPPSWEHKPCHVPSVACCHWDAQWYFFFLSFFF